MKTKFILLFAIGTLLAACSQELFFQEKQTREINLTEAEKQFVEKTFQEKKASQQNALDKALAFSNKGTTTRSASDFTLEDIILKKNINAFPDSMMTLLPDTIAYVFTTSDGQSTIVSADNRVQPEVLGQLGSLELYKDEGQYIISDLITEMIVSYAFNQIQQYETTKDSLMSEINKKLGGTSLTRAFDDPHPDPNPSTEIFFTDYSDWDTIVTVGPLVEAKWHQNAPYNDYVQSTHLNCEVPV